MLKCQIIEILIKRYKGKAIWNIFFHIHIGIMDPEFWEIFSATYDKFFIFNLHRFMCNSFKNLYMLHKFLYTYTCSWIALADYGKLDKCLQDRKVETQLTFWSSISLLLEWKWIGGIIFPQHHSLQGILCFSSCACKIIFRPHLAEQNMFFSKQAKSPFWVLWSS